MDAPLYIAVVGSSSDIDNVLPAAEEVGAEIARRGAVLVCGGLGGAMEAACRGARSGGGSTIGILPGLDRREANEFVDVAIPTGMGEMRNALIVRAADAVIALAGEFGTLSEIGFALRTEVPVVGLKTWELARGGHEVEAMIRANDPREAVKLALEAARG